MAISNVTQFTNCINTPMPTTVIPFNGANAAGSYIEGTAVATGYNLAIDPTTGATHAFRVVEGGLGANGATATASEVLTTEAVVEGGQVTGTNIIKFPAQQTGVGNVKAGALAGKVPIGTLLGGLAIGTGIGLKEAAGHETFWNDVVSIGDGINSPTDTVRVIWRMLEDGSIQSYCDKRTVDRLIARMYEYDLFNVFDHFEGSITSAGPQYISVGGGDSGILEYTAAQAGAGAGPYNTFYSAGAARYPQANAIQCGVTAAGSDDRVYVSVMFYNINTAIQYNVTRELYDGQYYWLIRDLPASSILGLVSGHFYASTGELIDINYSDGSPSSQPFTMVAGGRILTEGAAQFNDVGAQFIPKNPNVTYNGEDLLPPSDIEDFWNVFSLWLANALQQPGYNPLNNAIVPNTWIPWTMPNINWQTDPVSGTQPDIWRGIYPFIDPFPTPGLDPVANPEPWIWPGIGDWPVPPIDVPTPTPNPWDNTEPIDPVKPGPIGDTILPVPPTSGISGSDVLYTVYNPTQAQVNALGSYLWTQNILELIAQFFQNPLDAIISLHMVYCTPSTGANQNIKLGYLDSGVSAAKVTSQYVEINCGDIDIPEIYHNALDYSRVNINIFLPFIGFRPLKTKEVMGARVRVKYVVDVYTGICLAQIYVIRPGATQLLYTFEGNCAVQIPLTSADRSRLISGLVSAGIGVATGNPIAIVGGIASAGANIERSGSFSGNAGAMGVKKPYVVISRAINAQAQNYNSQYGYPINKRVKLASLKGYTRVESIHLDIPGATKYERDMIEARLKSGIVL